MGTIVLKKAVKDKKVTKWLLDGRQRRDTFVDMQNPDNIYDWAKEFLKLKSSFDEVKIEKFFNDGLNEYLYHEEEEEESEQPIVDQSINDEVISGSEGESEEDIDTTDSDEDLSEEDSITESGSDEESSLDPTDRADLADLLFIIQSVHKLTKIRNSDPELYSSGFTRPFDFKIKGFKPYFILQDNLGNPYVDSKRLTDWILSKNFSEIDTLTPEDILDCFDSRPAGLDTIVKNRLDLIKKSIKCVTIIHDKLTSARVSVITLDSSCSESDSQKIFEIINTHGQKLTNAEILSAKPIWTVHLKEPRETIVNNVAELYKGLGTKRQEGVVKWDVAATLTCRLTPDSDYIFGNIRKTGFSSTTKEESVKVDNKINYGFKLYAARYAKSISKNDVGDLADPKKRSIDWNSSSFEDEINSVCSFLMKQDSAIALLSSYHHSLNHLLGDTVAMCYLLLLIDKYNEITNSRSIPSPKGNKKKEFIVQSRVLLDRLFYEYCSGQWKGSSDSRLKENLDEPGKMFEPIEEEKWDALISEAYSKNTVNGIKVKKVALDALVYYFTMLRQKTLDLSEGESAQVDHIIPEATFIKNSSDYVFKDSLINFALLTPVLNNKKKANIGNIQETMAVKKICDLEDIDQETIKQLNNPGAFKLLKEKREGIIDEMIEKRKEFTKGEGDWNVGV